MDYKNMILEEFDKIFGNEGKKDIFFAPGRVNLIGEHTDYNGGHVFPCALTIGTYGVIRKREDKVFQFYSINMKEKGIIKVSLEDIHYDEKDDWANYSKGVLWSFMERGYTPECGADILVYGDIPNGSGLSSSASLEVLTGIMLRDTFGVKMDMVEIAQIGQYAENKFCGMNCGIMDQFASAMGKKDHAIFLDTNTLSYEYAPVVLPDAKIVITNSKVKHSLVSSAYNDRRRECEEALKDLQKAAGINTLGDLSREQYELFKSEIKGDINKKRAKHAVYENQRTIDAVKALKENDIEQFGKLMNESHVSLRDDYETSCEETDLLAELAWSMDGVIGSRITGGGFGGCTVSIVKNECVDSFIDTIKKEYLKKTGKTAEFYVVDIGEGAHKLV